MQVRPFSVSLWAFALWGAGFPVGAAGPDATTMLVNTCVACHGPGGSSQGPATPHIAGLAPDTFIDAMKAYRDGSRPATVMDRIAKGYTENEIELMADYFYRQNPVRLAQPTESDKAKAGEALHKQHCQKCHADNGRKDEDGTGILAGQWLPYLLYSIEDFLAGGRQAPKKMAAEMKRIRDADPEGLEKLMHFYASQKQGPGR
ncbi:MAG: c-type cytochrome [Rhodocyclaceae bacterium]